ncbi:MAG: hypothetical protein KDD35_05385 [Bdellovibrionales bacterium]|nr:hypothetical protein [Bdellovibrionales bacterium]
MIQRGLLKDVVVICLVLMGAAGTFAQAMDLDWTGVYRVEGYHIVNSDLSGKDREKSYGLHHLILKPRIVAGDGLTIYGRFDLLNSSQASLANSQAGQVFGSGIGSGTPTDMNNSNTLSRRQKAETLEVTQLYLTFVQEHGALVVGRTPLQFGLGMTHNAGNGLFDHWYDSRDLVGYKVVMGNFYILPMLGKVVEGKVGATDDVTDMMIQLQYDNPETDLEMGVFHQVRTANESGGDSPLGTAAGEAMGGAGPTADKVDLQTTSLYVVRDREQMKVGVEVTIQGGRPGVRTSAGDRVTVSAFGIAGEFEYRPESKKMKYGLKTGIASGDDPTTDDKYEGFLFSKNYDVAFLLFNHPLGKSDIFRSKLAGSDVGKDPVEGWDTETISNVFYIAPYLNYVLNDNWDLITSLITGFLNRDPSLAVEVKKSLGYELDIGLSYSPKKGVVWQTDLGLLMPGSAFEVGGTYDAEFAYGLSTKAAISF